MTELNKKAVYVIFVILSAAKNLLLIFFQPFRKKKPERLAIIQPQSNFQLAVRDLQSRTKEL
jgi:hypothetical protein